MGGRSGITGRSRSEVGQSFFESFSVLSPKPPLCHADFSEAPCGVWVLFGVLGERIQAIRATDGAVNRARLAQSQDLSQMQNPNRSLSTSGHKALHHQQGRNLVHERCFGMVGEWPIDDHSVVPYASTS